MYTDTHKVCNVHSDQIVKMSSKFTEKVAQTIAKTSRYIWPVALNNN